MSLFGGPRNRLTLVGELPAFHEAVKRYCARQMLLLPLEALNRMYDLAYQAERFDVLKHEIPFLRTCTLPAEPGSYETLLAIDHRRGPERFVVPVDILPHQPSELVWSCNGAICLGKINRAVAKLILMSDSWDPDSPQAA